MRKVLVCWKKVATENNRQNKANSVRYGFTNKLNKNGILFNYIGAQPFKGATANVDS